MGCWRNPRHLTQSGSRRGQSTELVEVLKSAGATGSVVRKLDPFTTLTLIRTDQGWALVAKDRKALGYVAAEKLHMLQ